MILITGKGTLAQSIANRFDDTFVVGKPEYDFSQQCDCDRLLHDYPSPDIIINTFAVYDKGCWETLTTNYVAPVYLTTQYYNRLTKGHIINISSTSSWWPSYPGIKPERLYYGLSKLNLSEFGQNFNRAIVDSNNQVIVSTIEPGKFKSPMSNYAGMDVEQITDLVEFVINNKIHQLSLAK
jgi:NAD(P)-dependent dehydrogenase (short-subunit alcohol dehydrogenase family)